jgi:hypothetical protein
LLELSFQVRTMLLDAPVATRLLGAAGAPPDAAGVAETCEELALWPTEFTAETT